MQTGRKPSLTDQEEEVLPSKMPLKRYLIPERQTERFSKASSSVTKATTAHRRQAASPARISTDWKDGGCSSNIPFEQIPIPEMQTGPQKPLSSDAKAKVTNRKRVGNPVTILTGAEDKKPFNKMLLKQISVAETQTERFPQRPLSSDVNAKDVCRRQVETSARASTDSEDEEPSNKMPLKQILIPEIQTERFPKGPSLSVANAKVVHRRHVENTAGSPTRSEDGEPFRKMPLKQIPKPEKQTRKFPQVPLSPNGKALGFSIRSQTNANSMSFGVIDDPELTADEREIDHQERPVDEREIDEGTFYIFKCIS